MDTIGVLEAKTNLQLLIDRVAKGEKITITKNGTPTAMLVPIDFSEREKKLNHREIVEGMKALREQIKPEMLNVRDLIEEGRRY